MKLMTEELGLSIALAILTLNLIEAFQFILEVITS